MPTRAQKGALSFAFIHFVFFGLLHYRTPCILGKFRFRSPAPIFPSNVGRPTQKGVPACRKSGLDRGRRVGESTMESEFLRGERWQFYF